MFMVHEFWTDDDVCCCYVFFCEVKKNNKKNEINTSFFSAETLILSYLHDY